MTVAPTSEIPVSCDNPQDWAPMVSEVQASGFEITMTPRAITELVATAVPAVFAAEASGNYQGLHTFFADDVVAELHRYPDDNATLVPRAVTIHLVGLPALRTTGKVILRIRLWITAEPATTGLAPAPVPGTAAAPAGPSVIGSFWDISQGQAVTVSRPSCPQCGAPVEMGSLRCRYCGGDVRVVTQVPLLVTRVQRY